MKAQERHYRPEEVLDIVGLGLVTAAVVGFLPLGVALGTALDFEFGTNAFDGGSLCSYVLGENLLFLHDAVIAGCLDSAG